MPGNKFATAVPDVVTTITGLFDLSDLVLHKPINAEVLSSIILNVFIFLLFINA